MEKQTIVQQKSKTFNIWAGILVFLIIIANILFVNYNSTFLVYLKGILFACASFLAVCAAFYAAQVYKFTTDKGIMYLCLLIGVIALFIGQSIWFAYDVVYFTRPFPALADVIILLVYPFIFMGFGIGIRSFSEKLFKTLIAFAVIASLAVPIFYPKQMSTSNEQTIFLILELLGTFLLIACSALTAYAAYKKKEDETAREWIKISIGMFIILAGNIVVTIFINEFVSRNTYVNLVEAMWASGVLLFASGLFTIGFIKNYGNKTISKK